MASQYQQVILVNENDEWMGTMEKLQAHKSGALHRAFSVFIINDKGEILLQQRASSKYHSASLWSNTCCSHPTPGESTMAAAHRRLMEEMGFDCELHKLFSLRYKSNVGNELVENEYDHIYLGNHNGDVKINIEEVKDYAYVTIEQVQQMLIESPELFTSWFKLALPKIVDYITQPKKV
jgi:isopentenyl-diphosphate delta-isomerase